MMNKQNGMYMKTNRLLYVFLLAFICITYVNAADYASIIGEPLTSLNGHTTAIAVTYNADNAKINGKTYSNYLTSLNDKKKAKYGKDISKVKQYIIKQFNKTNKRGFQLTEQPSDYVAEINITTLTFTEKKSRAKVSGTIDIRKQGSQQVITQICLSNFEGAKKNGMSNQLCQLSKDIIEYIAIYL